MDQACKSIVVPMRFYANWDFDRTSSSAIPRTLSMKFTRLALTKSLTTESALIIAVKLQGHRRILRSNDINILLPLRLDYALDISFTIQYCHFIKRKPNILEIFVQRRKKYKNRQIPGFKTLAFGNINLDEILQQGGSREVSIWDTTSLKRLSVQDFHAGTIYISNCQSQVVESGEQDTNKWMKFNGKYSNVLSEEEVDDYSSQDDSDFEDFEQRQPHQSDHIKRSRKKFKQKNIKQKVVALLKKFRVPDDEGNASNAAGSRTSRVLPPTELELQEIFEELENISDSGPELEPDKMSIVSNPRPGLRPFFGSKTDILPAIKDHVQSDDSVADSEDPDQESSEETPKESCFWLSKEQSDLDSNLQGGRLPLSCTTTLEQNTLNVQSPYNKFKHSATNNSIISISDNRQPTARSVMSSVVNKRSFDNSLFMEMLAQFDANGGSATFVVPCNIWLTSSIDFPWILRVDVSKLENIHFFDCPNITDLQKALYAIISRIQKFCNSNSAAPPTTRIGILGGDKTVSHVLRTYVDLLQNKACQEWLDYLRFSLITPPTSTVGRLFGQIPVLDNHLESLWRNTLSRLFTTFENDTATSFDYQDFNNCLLAITVGSSTNQQKIFNLPIGEVMLQLKAKALSSTVDGSNHLPDERNSLQVFVPFLSDLYLGNADEYANSSALFTMKNSFEECSASPGTNFLLSSVGQYSGNLSFSNSQTAVPSIPVISGNLSPPISPHSQKASDGRELHVEYWTSSLGNSLFNQSQNPQDFHSLTGNLKQQTLNSASTTSTTGNNKFSMKATVRNLCVTREPITNFMCILFVKERKKDKVLQKLGRKTKQKSLIDFNSQSRLVSNVTRMVCSSNKNSLLEVTIDGIPWRHIRYFQISCQWQTHVKLFPIFYSI